MTTTIQVSDETKRLLDSVKSERRFKTYDELIGELVRPTAGVPKSVFGAAKGSKRFTREVGREHEL